MSNWQPKWKIDSDSIPVTTLYEWLDDNTGETLFSVEITALGMIQVLQDDWLSKYSKAIYGSFEVDARFLRINATERTFSIIKNVDLIYTGETLLHVDSFLAYQDWRNNNATDEGGVSDEVPDVILEDIQSFINWTSAAAAVDAVGWILEFTAVNPAVAGVMTIASLAVGLWSALQDIVEANNPEITAEQFYAIIYTTTAWVYEETSDSGTYPTTDENLGEYQQYIPHLPFIVPRGVANPKSWFHIHGYRESFALGTMSKSLILNKLNLLKNTWQDTAAETIDTVVNTLYYNASHVLTGGNPSLTPRQYKQGLHTVLLPGNRKTSLEKSQFFLLLKAQTYNTFRANWIGPSAPLTNIQRKEKQYDSFYPVPR
jgi:hypothetical protein